MIHKKIEIWKENEYNGADKAFKPILSTYIMENKEKKAAILVLPGGGYGFTSPREAEPIALWANSIGCHSFVLNYSVAPNKHPQPLLDVTRAMCIIRDNAEEWNIDENKIAVCGFSAGGHLTASIAVYWNAPYLQNIEGMSEGKNKPNAVILSYPVITGDEKAHRGSFNNLLGENASQEMIYEMSLENHVSKSTPPAFIWATFNDAAVPVESSLLFASSMRKNDIPFELHIFPDGVHGLSLSNKQTWEGNPNLINPQTEVWTSLCKKWLESTLDI